ncbi:MAG: SH3-like domain-containing protein [Melioribacteraceae bacterium]|jgi:hypothetical protein|nr:SH3-like domain-containing protein [Melioribacteraceae bacterium]
MKNILLLVLISVIGFSACSKEKESTETNNSQSTMQAHASSYKHEITVKEVLQVKDYTYLRAQENDSEIWIAIPRADIKVGSVLLFNSSMTMNNFESKDLKRTFETILFVEDVQEKLGAGMMTSPQKPKINKEDVVVEPAADGITISELYSKTSKYEGKKIKIRGKVVKFNPAIMKTNWVHIQDGTSYDNNFDLTITTNDMVNVGDVFTFEGKVVLDKDFGYGYSYKVLLENAKLTGVKTTSL